MAVDTILHKINYPRNFDKVGTKSYHKIYRVANKNTFNKTKWKCDLIGCYLRQTAEFSVHSFYQLMLKIDG